MPEPKQQLQDAWNPAQYHRFRRERSQPFYDLLEGVNPIPGGRAIDLGCGAGELTRDLHERVQARETLGIDSSSRMLEQARTIQRPGLSFELRSIEAMPEGPYDLVFANAALQWVTDHEALLPRIAHMLAPGGQLAIQVPANDLHPSHRIAAEVAREEPYRQWFDDYVRVSPVLSLERYAVLLHDLGLRGVRVQARIYAHELPSPEDVVEWVKGTCLSAYERRLAPEQYSSFLDTYRQRVLKELGPSGKPYFYPFRRVLFWAKK